MKSRTPFLVAAFALLGHLGLFYRAIIHHTGGAFCYPLDDAFIHLALARNIAFGGVYGITHFAFTSASSSVVWPFLLAAVMKVVGDQATIPFFLNVVLGLGLVWVIAEAFAKEAPGASLAWRTILTLAVVLLMPLSTIVVIGMEHTLHALMTIVFVLEAARVLANPPARFPMRLMLLAFGMVAARYEGLFLVGIASLLFALRAKLRIAAILAAVGGAPVIAFGLYAKAHGALFLPNSVVLKGSHFDFSNLSTFGDLLGGNVLKHLLRDPYVLPILIVPLALLLEATWREPRWSTNNVRLGLAVAGTAAHLELASLGWFFRYEAYFVALAVTVTGLAIAERIPNLLDVIRDPKRRWQGASGAVIVVILVAPLASRMIDAADATPLACRNIYEQQVQSARFLGRYFGDATVAINDIGAVAYFGGKNGNMKIVDLVGLASLDVARAKSFQIDKPLKRADVARFTKDARVAILYDEWFDGVLPRSWVLLGRWRIENLRSSAFPAVSIYATSGDDVPFVLASLKDFSASLPEHVHEEGRYAEPVRNDQEKSYRLGVGDVVEVQLDGAEDLGGTAVVLADGNLGLPKIGLVKARGCTEREVEANTRARIDKVRDVEHIPPIAGIRVKLLEPHSYRFYIAGQVTRSGEISPTGPATLGSALDFAGVDHDGANAKAVFVWREDASGLQSLPFDPSIPANRDVTLRAQDIVVVR